jgi:hypothetical protein
MPAVSNAESTLQVTNINTMANIEVIDESDHIQFKPDYHPDTGSGGALFTINFKAHAGFQYEGIPSWFNQLVREKGQIFGLACEVGDMRRLYFKSDRCFRLSDISRNASLLFGWRGLYGPELTVGPRDKEIYAKPYEQMISRNSAEASLVSITSFTMEETLVVALVGEFYAKIPYTISPNEASGYRMEWTVDEWETPAGQKDWLTINKETGTMRFKEFDPKVPQVAHYCKIKTEVFQGGTSPLFTKTCTLIATTPMDTDKPTNEARLVGKSVLLYGEETAYVFTPANWSSSLQVLEYTKIDWYVSETSQLKFTGFRELRDGGWHGRDDHYWVAVKAGGQPNNIYNEEKLYCKATQKVGDEKTFSFTITVLNDLIPIVKYKMDPPSVGCPMSTPQLYLMSNAGNQIYRNTVDKPRAFDNAIVLATLQNSFSPGYPIMASGDAPTTIPTTQLADLSFYLVDGNFNPIRLLNPLTLTIQVNPVLQNLNNDLSQWNGKLPLDAPTPQLKAEQEAQAKLQQEQQAQKDQEEKVNTEYRKLADRCIVEYFAPRIYADKQQQAIAEQKIQEGLAKRAEREENEKCMAIVLTDPTFRSSLMGLRPEEAQELIKLKYEEVKAQRQNPPPPPPPPPTPEQQVQIENDQVAQTIASLPDDSKQALADTLSKEDDTVVTPSQIEDM